MKPLEQIIAALKAHDEVTALEVYTPRNNGNWGFYINIFGFINDDYFDFTIRNRKDHLPVELEIYETTDCREELIPMLFEIEPKLEEILLESPPIPA